MNSKFRCALTLVRQFSPLVVLLALVLIPACSPKKGGDQSAGNTGDYVNGTPLSDRPEGGTSFMSSNVDRHQFQPISFAFDSQVIGSSENGKIQQIASFLQQGRSQIIIAGFTDERGTAEYNRGLGERRAESVREALIASGASAQSIQTVSFGADMPADPSSNEEAWAKNRRAEIGVIK
ncbi:MAG: OmpA family protein [Chthoniobacterales bacterium]|nr:OmpA family protein [Chthoniobacterales bacterium]